MNKELINTLEELSNKSTTELALSYMEIYSDYLELKERIDKTIEYLEYQLENLDFEKDTKAKMLCAMTIVSLQESGNNEK